jgi:hypothetical protein
MVSEVRKLKRNNESHVNMKRNILATLFFTFSFFLATCQPTIQWQKSLGGTDAEYAYSLQQTNDGGFIVAGRSSSNNADVSGNHGGDDFWVVKLNNTGAIEWQKSLGGSNYDAARSIQQTNDGGYIVVGDSYSNDGDVSGNHGNVDLWVVKLTNYGIIEWQESLGGSGYDNASSIQQTNDGGFVVAGTSFSNDGDVSGNHGLDDSWVVKLSSIGAIEWQKSLGGTDGEATFSIQQTIDGGYILAGNSNSNDGDVSGNQGLTDSWVIKLSSIGTIEWQKTIGGTGYDAANSILQTNDGGYVVAGTSNSNDGDVSGNHGGFDDWIVKLSSLGTIEWQKSLGGSAEDFAFAIQHSNDGGYIVAGHSTSNDGDVSGSNGFTDYWAVKLTSEGAIQWQKSLGGSGIDKAYSLQQTNDGGYIVSGASNSNDGDVSGNQGSHDFWVVKLNTCQPIESILTFNECDPFSVNGIIYSNSGIYTQTLTNVSGCDSILTIEAEILNFNGQIFQTDTTLYYNGNPTSIQWINCSTGQAIPGANQVVFVPQQTGNYGAIITIGECVDTSNCRLIPVPPIPKSPTNICENINVSPNPVIDQVSFTLDKESYSINLYSSTGALVLQKTGTPEKQKIDFRNYAPAMYLLQVDQCRYKIVKQ